VYNKNDTNYHNRKSNHKIFISDIAPKKHQNERHTENE